MSGFARGSIGAWWAARTVWAAFGVLELLLAVLAALPASITAASQIGTRGFLAQLTGAGWPNALSDLAAAAAGPVGSPAGELSSAILATTALALATSVLHGLVYTLLSGGMLAKMSGAEESFWREALAWFWPLLRLGLIVAALAVLLGAAGLVALAFIPDGGVLSMLLKAVMLLAWMALAGSLFELARATMVARGKRSALRGIGHALRLVQRRPALVALVWVVLWLGNVVLALVSGALILLLAGPGPAVWLAAFFIIWSGAAYKALRLAAQLQIAGDR